MKRFFFFTLFFAGPVSAQQIPYFPIDNYAPTSGAQTIAVPFGMVAPTNVATPVTVSQTAQINFVAGTRLALHPGFSAGTFSGNGYFHGQIGTAPDFEVVFIEPNQNTPFVGQFEKLEMGLRLPAVIEQQVNDFLANSTGGLNPFDPEQISVEANFTNGVNSYTVYGFYYDEFIRDPNAMAPFAPANWISQATDYHWRIRFAPPSIGNWYCTISIRLNNALSYAYAVNGLYFQCIPSSNEGWLEKGSNDWYLRYSGSNRSFFAIGQNISWNDRQSFYGGLDYTQYPNYPISQSGYLDILDRIINLSENGGNMVRSVNVGNAYELELHHLGNYADRMNRAWEMDQLFELCEQRNMKISLQCANLRFADEPGNFGWNDNPYHTQIPLSDKSDFFINSEAEKYFKTKLRYFMSRWGYSTSLGIIAVSGEIDGHISNYESNEGLQAQQVAWHEIMFALVKSLVDYRPLLTTTSYRSATRGSDYHGAFSPLRTPFDLDKCDITTMHSYHAERWANHERLDEFNQGISNRGLHTVWEDKPTYFEELGVATDFNGLSIDPDDLNACSDVTYHNDLWATSFMGGFGTGFNWWQPNNNDYRSANFPAANAFWGGIDFESFQFKYPDFWDNAFVFNGDHSSSTIETFYIRDEHARRVMGWVHNTTYWWGNIVQNCMDRYNNLPDTANDDDNPSSPQALPLTTTFEIHGLNNLQNYNLEWFETRNNGGLFQTEQWQANIFGTMKPVYQGANPLYYAPDWAFKAYRAFNNFRQNGEIPTDTLFCWQDTVEVNGNHELDSLNHFSYYWNFGNGQQSNEGNTTAIYSQAGTYLVTLIVTDSLGWSDTLRQYIVKPEPCIASKKITPVNEGISSWDAFPNPVSNTLTIQFNDSWSASILVELYSIDGKCVFRQLENSKRKDTFPITDFPAGCYIVKVIDETQSDSKRIIIVH